MLSQSCDNHNHAVLIPVPRPVQDTIITTMNAPSMAPGLVYMSNLTKLQGLHLLRNFQQQPFILCISVEFPS